MFGSFRPAILRLWQRWDHFWFGPIDLLPLGVFRIALSLFYLVILFCLAPNWERYFSASGIPSLTGAYPFPSLNPRFCLFYWTDGIIPIGGYWWLGVLACVGLALGWKTRFWSWTLYGLEMSMLHRNYAVASMAEDMVLTMLLFYGCFAPWGETLSLDRALVAAPNRQDRHPPTWPVRMIQIHIVFIYSAAAAAKWMLDPSWRTRGDALYWILLNNNWGNWPWPQWLHQEAGWMFCRVFTYLTILIEASFPVLVAFRRTRLFALVAVAVLHLGMILFMKNVVFFQVVMLIALVLWFPADKMRNIGLGIR